MNEGIDIGDEWGWDSHPKTQAFMQDIIAACRKHGLAITPTQSGEISHHDPMTIVPLADNFEQYLRKQVYFSPIRLGIDHREIG